MTQQISKLRDRSVSQVEVEAPNLCPTCEQPIAYERAEEIRRHIVEKEGRDAEALSERIAFERDLARKEAIETANKAAEAKVAEATEKRDEAEARLAELTESQDFLLETARKEAAEEASKAVEAKVAEADRKRGEAETLLAELKENQEQNVAERIAEVREACDADKDRAVNKAKSEEFEKEQKLQEELGRVTRLLERKTANELGEGAEVDLFEALKSEFPDDKIRRVAKGEPGADIIHEIYDNGALCGTIVYDSKNRARWLNDYVEKLRKDQIAAKADAAVLTTSKFPRGARQLHVQDGVITTNPARAVVVAQILRRHVIQMHGLRLSNDGREEKMVLLYELITSEEVAQSFDRLETINERLLELDVKEKKAHDKVWVDRGELIRENQRALGKLTCDIDRVVGQVEVEEDASA